eukprot:4963781-Amphidinium_carterae.1
MQPHRGLGAASHCCPFHDVMWAHHSLPEEPPRLTVNADSALRFSQQTYRMGPVQELSMIDMFKSLCHIRLQGQRNLLAVPSRLCPDSKNLCGQLATLYSRARVLSKLPERGLASHHPSPCSGENAQHAWSEPYWPHSWTPFRIAPRLRDQDIPSQG